MAGAADARRSRANLHMISVRLFAIVLVILACRPAGVQGGAAEPAGRWWRGNTHTHTLWSDGDDFPEMVADWYRRNGYDFLALTDHNTLGREETRWMRIPADGLARDAYRKYLERFGPQWVDERRSGDTLLVRLRSMEEYRARIDSAGRFLLVQGEEITQYLDRKGAHMNALHLADLVPAQPGATLIEMFLRDLAVVRGQEQAHRRDIVAVLNHPNFLWSQTAEDLLQLPDLRFFEVYNGHPLVNTLGDTLHPSTERIWDIVLTQQAQRGGVLLFGVATDDAHDYHAFAPAQRNPGRGWVMVRAPSLSADALMAAMKRGDFYASTGVTLDELRFDGRRITLGIRAEPGVSYATQFIGTRRGYDSTAVVRLDSAGAPVTRRYTPEVGQVLAEATGASASYVMRGDELYVRARITSSRAKSNPSYPGELEMAWTQPIRP